MPVSLTEEENQFVAAAKSRGSITQAMVDEALKERDSGETTEKIPDILVRMGFLSSAQAKTLLTEAQKSGERAKNALGPYDLLSKLGQGGMGIVYKARHREGGQVVALKVLPTSLAKNKVFTERFLREASAAQRLDHPNIVRGLDVGVANGYHYFAMEFVDGESLSARLKREGRIPEADALGIVRQIASALQCAHEHQIVHRDIKPENVMFTRDGVAKLTDFGLAKNVAEATIAQITQTGMVLGTPYYLSPEQAKGEKRIDIRSDLYSLGATLYHLTTGEPPFSGTSVAVIVSKHITEAPEEPRRKNPGLSEGANRLISRLLAKSPDARPQTPAAVLEAVDRIRQGLAPFTDEMSVMAALPSGGFGAAEAPPPAPVPAPAPARRRKARTSAGATPLPAVSRSSSKAPLLVLGGAVAAAVAAVFLFLKPPAPSAKPPADGARTDPAARPGVAGASADALKAFEEASFWAADNPMKAKEAVRRLRDVASRFPSEPAAGRAKEKADELEKSALQRAKAAFGERKADFDEAVSRRDFPTARKAYEGFPAGLDLDGRYGKEISGALAALDGREAGDWQEEDRKADAARKAGDTGKALAIYQGATSRYTKADIREAARARLSSVEAGLSAADRAKSAQETEAREQAARIRDGIGTRSWRDLYKEFEAFCAKHGGTEFYRQRKADFDALGLQIAGKIRSEEYPAEQALVNARAQFSGKRWAELQDTLAKLDAMPSTFAARAAAAEIDIWRRALDQQGREREQRAERLYTQMLQAYQTRSNAQFQPLYAEWYRDCQGTQSARARQPAILQMRAYLESTATAPPAYTPPATTPTSNPTSTPPRRINPVNDVKRVGRDIERTIRGIFD